MNAAPDWFHNAIVDGLTLLAALELPFTPKAATLPGTVAAWVGVLWDGGTRNFEGQSYFWAEADLERIQKTFIKIANNYERWPTPAAFRKFEVARTRTPAGLIGWEDWQEPTAAEQAKIKKVVQSHKAAMAAQKKKHREAA